MQVWPGDAYPLGASYDGTGTNFALFSELASRVVLCLFDQAGNEWTVPDASICVKIVWGASFCRVGRCGVVYALAAVVGFMAVVRVR